MSRKSSAKSSSAAIHLLDEDHKKVIQLFNEFEELCSDEEDLAAKQALVEKICAELSIHAQIEEEIFYPALREVIEDTSLLNEAEVEHNIASRLIIELETMQPEDALYDAKVIVLGEYVRHHIEEEQEELFQKAMKAKLDMDSIGEALRARKEALLAEFGIAAGDQIDVVGEVRLKRGGQRNHNART